MRQSGTVHSQHHVGRRNELQLLLHGQALQLNGSDTEARVAGSQSGLQLRLVGDLAAYKGGRVASVSNVVTTTDNQQRNRRTVETVSTPVHGKTSQDESAQRNVALVNQFNSVVHKMFPDRRKSTLL